MNPFPGFFIIVIGFSDSAVLFVEDVAQTAEYTGRCLFGGHNVGIVLQALYCCFLSVVEVFRNIDHHVHQQVAFA